MKNYKRLLSLMLVLAMLVTMLAGCGAEQDASTDDTLEKESITSTASESASNETSADVDITGFTYSTGIDDKGFWEGTRAIDHIEMFDYKAMLIPSAAHTITDEALQTEIDNLLSNYSTGGHITDRAVVDGDSINIDYVGSVDGVEFSGGSTAGAGTDVTIGITSYIDDFLEQLIGHMPGETFNVEVTFPDVYAQNTDLQGKEAVFVTTINYIVDSVMPELTDEFVNTNFSSYGWDTVAKMKEVMLSEMQKESIQQYVTEYFSNEVTIKSMPDKLIDYQDKAMILYYQEGADYYSMELDEFLASYVGVADIETLIEDNRAVNLENANYSLVAQALAEDLGLSITDDDLVKYYDDYTQYEAQYGLPYLRQIVLYEKVIEYIMDNAVKQ